MSKDTRHIGLFTALRTKEGTDQMRAFAEALTPTWDNMDSRYLSLFAAAYMLGRTDAHHFAEPNGSAGPMAEAVLRAAGWFNPDEAA